MDGTSSLFIYELREAPLETNSGNTNYITREEFEKVIAELRAAATATSTATKLEAGLSKLF
jgi:hypothetical protein